MSKATKVKLSCQKKNPKIKDIELTIEHAERLLNMNNNGGWELADAKYILEDGNIKPRTTKGTN